jgi:nucleoside-diphosphate-sugar epimerase
MAVERGFRVRGLVRDRAPAEPLAAMGVELVEGDVRDQDSVKRAVAGADTIVHAAAQIGGTWSTATPKDFESVNRVGTINVLDAGEAHDVARTVVLLSAVVVDAAETVTEASRILPISPDNSPYARAKLAAYYEGMARAAGGMPVTFVIPGGIYGPTPLIDRALVPTIFTGTLMAAARGELTSYLPSRHSWVLASEVAAISLAAAENGRTGARYLAMGRSEDVSSLPAFCNLFMDLAGIDRRVGEVDLNDPSVRGTLEARFGSMVKYVRTTYPEPHHDPRATTAELGIEPGTLVDGLHATVEWLRSHGRLPLSPATA